MSDTEALNKLLVVERDARKFGFEWPNTEIIIDQAISESEEIREVITNQESRDRLQEEIGDLIHTAISLCEFAGFDTNETIAKAAAKFDSRMRALKFLTKQHDLENLHGQSFEFMLDLWREAKHASYT